MTVFVTYCKDGYGGDMVDKIFAKEPDAINYVIDNVFRGNVYYQRLSIDQKQKEALKHIDEYEVII